MGMNQIQDRAEKVFHPQDLVLWHTRSENRLLPIPGVVIHQEGDKVFIRARVEGNMKEIVVSTDELIER
jgi:hypothetical protein